MKRKKSMMWITLGIIGLLAIIVAIVLNHPAFGRSPRGERLERIMQSPNYRGGKFQNLSPTEIMTSSKESEPAAKTPAEGSKELAPTKPITAVKTDLMTLNLKENQLVWFGHSSYLLVLSGKSFLVDPVLTTSFPASIMMRPFKGTDIYSPADIPPVDYLIITHDHYDHLDYNTVRSIRERVGRVICPLGVGEHLEYWGYDAAQITEMDWNESTQSQGVTITCLPARHFSGRFLKRNPTLWASFMIECGSTVYVGGDSGYDKHFAEIGRRFPNIDLALLENGQYNEAWRNIHTMPDLLPQAIKDLGAAKIQPIHNSKYALSRHAWNEPMDRINAVAAVDSTIHLLGATIGQSIVLNASPNQRQ